MRNKIVAFGLLFVLVLTLNGCYSDAPLPLDDTATEVPISSFSGSKKETSDKAPETEITENSQEVVSEVPAEEETEYSKDTAETATTTVPTVKETPKSDDAEKQNKPTQNKSESTEIKTPQTSEPTKPETSTPPPETEKPKEEPTTKPTEQPTTEPTKEPQFDINYWTTYAKNYAQSIGLTLDNTAVDCWDNPISANPRRANIEADIISRLNRYKNVEEFTSVWIWAEKVSDTDYEIYIGYA